MPRAAIDVETLRTALAARWLRVDVMDEVGSTNELLMDDAEAPDRSVLVAEFQNAGRGRLDRTWTSPPRAGLTFSVLLRPDTPIATWGWLPLLAGVALRAALVDQTGVDLALKWPNDLLHAPTERKLAGVLAQTSGPAVVIGIGLNVSTSADELGTDEATSLALCGVTDPDRSGLLVAILNRLDRWVVAWAEHGGDAEAAGLADAYRGACATLGREVAVTTTSGQALRGRADGIDADGRLVLDVGGRSERVGAGDVEHLRPPG
jgi:BirA family transcriptional regulator, biotin operon repressor / biotin---[acetyl-CoA-carboxylase] ligase